MAKGRIDLFTVSTFYFGLFVVAMWVHWFKDVLRFGVQGPDRVFMIGVHCAIGVTAGAMVVIVNAAAVRWTPSLRMLAKAMDELVGPVTWPEAFLLAAFSAVSEEFFFRGILQPYVGIVATSVLFGMLHSGPGKTFLAWTVFAMLAGFLFGALYQVTGDLFTPVAAHFVVNFLNLKALRHWAEKRAS